MAALQLDVENAGAPWNSPLIEDQNLDSLSPRQSPPSQRSWMTGSSASSGAPVGGDTYHAGENFARTGSIGQPIHVVSTSKPQAQDPAIIRGFLSGTYSAGERFAPHKRLPLQQLWSII